MAYFFLSLRRLWQHFFSKKVEVEASKLFVFSRLSDTVWMDWKAEKLAGTPPLLSYPYQKYTPVLFQQEENFHTPVTHAVHSVCVMRECLSNLNRSWRRILEKSNWLILMWHRNSTGSTMQAWDIDIEATATKRWCLVFKTLEMYLSNYVCTLVMD